MEPTRDVSRQEPEGAPAESAAGSPGRPEGGPPFWTWLPKRAVEAIGLLVAFLVGLDPLIARFGPIPAYGIGGGIVLGLVLYWWYAHRGPRPRATPRPTPTRDVATPPPPPPRANPRWIRWVLRLTIVIAVVAAALALRLYDQHRRVLLPRGSEPGGSPASSGCERTREGELRLVVEPGPARPRGNGWSASCCVELGRAGVRVPASSSLRVLLTLEHADRVELKVEQGRYGDADHVGWLMQGPLEAGTQGIDGPLRIAPGGPPLDLELRAHRICAALVDGGPERNELRLKTAAWH